MFSATDNYDAPRTGQVLVRWPAPTAGQNLQIVQAVAGDGAVFFTVGANPTTSSRTSTIAVRDQTVTITQVGAVQNRRQ